MASSPVCGWVILCVPTCDPARVRGWVTELEPHAQGIVTLGPAMPDAPSVRSAGAVPPRGGRLACVEAALAVVPEDAELLTLVDEEALEVRGPAAVLEVHGALTATDVAAVRVLPVTDALKRVEGSAVAGGVDREGLVMARTPQVLRRAPLQAALRHPAIATAHDDPAVLLAAAGGRVALLPDRAPSPPPERAATQPDPAPC